MIGMVHLQLFGNHNHKKWEGRNAIRSKRSSRSNSSTGSCSETDWATGTAKKGATHMSGPFLRPIKLNAVRERLASGCGEELAGFDRREIFRRASQLLTPSIFRS